MGDTMKKRRILALLFTATLVLTSCGKATPATSPQTTTEPHYAAEADTTGLEKYKGKTAEEIVASLTLEQKAAQMVEGAIYNVSYDDMKENDYGSILSRYDEIPAPDQNEWMDRINQYQDSAITSEAAIPNLYGQDSVHGVNFASECVIFPHNINMGAVNDPALTKEYGACVGADIVHTGMILNFSPCVDASQDPRWGRTYECFSDNNDMVKELSVAYAEGLLSQGVVVCAKHFFGYGYAKYGTGEVSDGITRIIDRGDAQMTQEEIDEQLAVYKALIDAGVQSIMVAHSSLFGTKMHENA